MSSTLLNRRVVSSGFQHADGSITDSSDAADRITLGPDPIEMPDAPEPRDPYDFSDIPIPADMQTGRITPEDSLETLRVLTDTPDPLKRTGEDGQTRAFEIRAMSLKAQTEVLIQIKALSHTSGDAEGQIDGAIRVTQTLAYIAARLLWTPGENFAVSSSAPVPWRRATEAEVAEFFRGDELEEIVAKMTGLKVNAGEA